MIYYKPPSNKKKRALHHKVPALFIEPTLIYFFPSQVQYNKYVKNVNKSYFLYRHCSYSTK